MFHLKNSRFHSGLLVTKKTKEQLPLTGWCAYLWPGRSWKLVQMDGRVPVGQIPWYLLTS